MTTSKCEVCGDEFWHRPSRPRRYCSRKCFGQGRSAEHREIVQCEVCGTAFERGGRYQAGQKRKSRTTRFCSRRCAADGRFRHGSECNTLSPEQAAYTAGVWDSDGTFGLYHTNGDAVTFRCQIGVTKPEIIDWLVQTTGMGAPQRRRHSQKNPRHADVYSWAINSIAAESFARQIEPYLVLKGPRARLGIEFMERMRVPALQADRTWQQEYRERMMAMNRKGVGEEAES